MRVLCVGNNLLERQSIAHVLSLRPGLELAGETGIALEDEPAEARVPAFDVALVDLDGAFAAGLRSAQRLRSEHPEAAIVLIGSELDEDYGWAARELGATDVLRKTSTSLDQLLGELHRAHEKRRERPGHHRDEGQQVPPLDTETGLSAIGQPPELEAAGQCRLRRAGVEPNILSRRETQILRLIADGKSKKQIAQDLNLSVRTIETFTARIMDKLGIRDRVKLARFAYRRGIAPL